MVATGAGGDGGEDGRGSLRGRKGTVAAEAEAAAVARAWLRFPGGSGRVEAGAGARRFRPLNFHRSRCPWETRTPGPL